jgi:hypothetical protein
MELYIYSPTRHHAIVVNSLHSPYQLLFRHRAHNFVGHDNGERAGGRGLRTAKIEEERKSGGGREEAYKANGKEK